MHGVVDAMWMLSPGAIPKANHRARRPGPTLEDRFAERTAELAAFLGDPRTEPHPAWYPTAVTAACWPRGDRVVVLVLERPERTGPRVVLWCLTDAERATLEDASRARPDRLAGFEADFDRRFAVANALGRGRVVERRILADDLATLPPPRSDALLGRKLADPDGEVRCGAAELTAAVAGPDAVPRLLTLFDDPEPWVRQHAIELVGGWGDETAIPVLERMLRSDPDPFVRGEAAHALGSVGEPAAIPALLHALDHDHEVDGLGHTPSSISAAALDNILGTNETRLAHAGGFCSMAPWPPDLDRLRALARQVYAAHVSGAG